MNVEIFKKIAPKAYYGKQALLGKATGRFLEHDIRPDGRTMDLARNIILSEGWNEGA